MSQPESERLTRRIDIASSILVQELPRHFHNATRTRLGQLIPKLVGAILAAEERSIPDTQPSSLFLLQVLSKDTLGLLYYPDGLSGPPQLEDLITVVIFLIVHLPRFNRAALMLTDTAAIGATLESVLTRQLLLDIRTLLDQRLQLPTKKGGVERRVFWDGVLEYI